MSLQTKELQEVFKDAQEVTSLGSTDRLLAKDANGNLKGIRSFFSVNKVINFTESNGGHEIKILIADIGAYPVATGFGLHGFSGICYKSNVGAIDNGFGSAVVNAVACYSLAESYGVKLDTTQEYIKPSIVTYNGRAYVAISVNGNSGSLCLVGFGHNLLDTPIVLGSKTGTPADTSVTLYSGNIILGGGKSLSFNQLRKYIERRWVA